MGIPTVGRSSHVQIYTLTYLLCPDRNAKPGNGLDLHYSENHHFWTHRRVKE
jgi:hypothetical protein